MSHSFQVRHIGPSQSHLNDMLDHIGVASVDELINQTVPDAIRLKTAPSFPDPLTEPEALKWMQTLAKKNQLFTSFIGQGYYGTYTPSVLLRNIFENPGWYTQYTPYQSEISQGRLEALITFQTMVMDLTGMPVANASLLDEATAAAEAMALLYRVRPDEKKDAHTYWVSDRIFTQTLAVMQTRAKGLGISLETGPVESALNREDVFGVFIQYPDAHGQILDHHALVHAYQKHNIRVSIGTDLLALTLITPPGEWGVDVVVGSAQRFGVPMGYGGPHAAFIAVQDCYKRSMPGRIIGLSVDKQGKPAYRMALQTREQHIRREKATSNICTAQALLAIMAAMYAVYHGAQGLIDIANRIHMLAKKVDISLQKLGFSQENTAYFDTLSIRVPNDNLYQLCQANQINIWYQNGQIGISVDETTTEEEVDRLISIFASQQSLGTIQVRSPLPLYRQSPFLTHPVFCTYHHETAMLRYLKQLESKDISLTTSMIPLGSCTMKLNATTQMMPVSWPEFSTLHPFVPLEQAKGYQIIFKELESFLCTLTGFDACSLQPNSGAQGEYAGLLCIRRYHDSREDTHRQVVLIPTSAHGTNPATATLLGWDIVLVACDSHGNILISDVEEKAKTYASRLGAFMVTYPSTHGVFEENIQAICDIIHQYGGLVYMDGANMNAQVGLTNPATIGADVCHLNLHKTFAIPHGGGGPGMGPICVTSALAPFLPGHPLFPINGGQCTHAVSAAPWGSASILLISYLYIRLLGFSGMKRATEIAIVNANYIQSRLKHAYPILFVGSNGFVAHELIIDCRAFKKATAIEVEDIAKRLMDYGFHAPTMSFPVPGTLMIEPTESEDKEELDRFCDALLAIREEIREIENGIYPTLDNVLKQSPHTAEEMSSTEWAHPYSREKAAYPISFLKKFKYWPSVKRVDNAYGDRTLFCACFLADPVEVLPKS